MFYTITKFQKAVNVGSCYVQNITATTDTITQKQELNQLAVINMNVHLPSIANFTFLKRYVIR